jgi:diacylglycerol kinase family enzyme
MTLARFKGTEGTVVCDTRTYEGRITNLVVANCQFFGGGMHVAPKATPTDGRLDVLIQIGTKADYVAAITKVFKGKHIPSPAIKEYKARRVEITTKTPLRVEADGELLGMTPATFQLYENALRLKV